MAQQPLHQFEIHPLIPLSMGGVDVSFTNAALAMVMSGTLVVLLFFWGTRQQKLIPSRLQAIAELGYKVVATLVNENIGNQGYAFFPFVFSIFFFVLGGNIFGMFPYAFTFTSHLIATFGLAVLVITVVTIVGLVKNGTRFLRTFVPAGVPWPVLLLLTPIELISYCSRPFSLAVRLFANMMAGHTMLKVFAGFSTSLGALYGVFPMGLNVILTGFELLIAVLQAYVFSVLTCVYLHDAVHVGH
ncbi:MAG: F0F1 ATP synthase subunit A [Holosporales bacterium]|jgi:F-type H+-transporting ATPase subunit a|nr:F0F1 ATP synthase subunit A [Holosporales bacterium]